MRNLKPKGRGGTHEFSYSKITDQIYLGSDFCKSGMCKIHGEEFKSLGVSVEINLSLENNELPPKDIEAYLWLPVVDGHAPSSFQFNAGVCAINDAVKAGKKVYIHCKNGHGRSPTLLVAYLIRLKKMGVDEAIEFIAKKRPEIHVEDSQREALLNFSKQ